MQKLKQKILNNANNIFEQQWFKQSLNFLQLKKSINITNIFVSEVKKKDLFNILYELELFLKDFKSLTINIHNNIDNNIDNHDSNLDNNIDSYIYKLLKLVKKINKYQNINNKSKKIYNNLLQKNLEIHSLGKYIKKKFFKYIKEKHKLKYQSELLINPYTSIINLNEIYLQSNYHITFEANLLLENNDYYNINLNDIILFTPTNIIKNKNINNYITDISIRLFLIQYLSKNKNNPSSTILYLINYKKEFMSHLNNEIIFTSNEINTGVTNGKDVIITRKEESMKTLLHEYIHFYKLDFCNVNIPDYINKWILNKFNLTTNNNNICIYEAYTEWLASILHILSKIFTSNKLNNITTINKKFKILYLKQVKYTFHKCSQILAISRCSSLKEFINSNNNNNNNLCKLKEETNVFCYYYLKLSLYLYFNILQKIINNKNSKFIVSNNNFTILLLIFKKFNKNNYVRHYLNILINKYYKYYYLDNNNKCKKFKTLKMVVIE